MIQEITKILLPGNEQFKDTQIESKDILENLGFTHQSFDRSSHYRSLTLGCEVEFQEGQFRTFFAYFRELKINSFTGVLPFGIHKNWSLKAAVMYLGEPPIKSNRMVEITYPHLGVGIVFDGAWSQETNQITSAYFFQKEASPMCANCKKSLQVGEGKSCQCKIVAYCGPKCQKQAYWLHTIICQDVD